MYVYLSIYPSIHLSIYLSTYLSIYISTYLSVYKNHAACLPPHRFKGGNPSTNHFHLSTFPPFHLSTFRFSVSS